MSNKEMTTPVRTVFQWRIPAVVHKTYITDGKLYCQFEGSWEAICLGAVQLSDPPIAPGTVIDIIFRPRVEAQSCS